MGEVKLRKMRSSGRTGRVENIAQGVGISNNLFSMCDIIAEEMYNQTTDTAMAT